MFNLFKKSKYNRNIINNDINMEELIEKYNNGAIIIDVRSIQEYNENHLFGAINIPYYEIKKKAKYYLKNTDQEIVVYCQSGNRSIQAYRKLIKMNYTHVYNLYGGLDNWM